MTINVAFKTPDGLVFATDGLATICEVDPTTGKESIISSVEDVEKLSVLSDGTIVAMFNGIGSLGNGSVANEIQRFDRRKPREPRESVGAYAERLRKALEGAAHDQLGTLPRPFHVVIGGFDAHQDHAPPKLYEFKWSRDRDHPDAGSLKALFHVEPGDHSRYHTYGPFYAGATEGVSRFVEGFDARMPHDAIVALSGIGRPGSAPGILEELIHEARRQDPPAADLLEREKAEALALKYAGRIANALFRPEKAALSEHFSMREALNFTVFAAWCAYARENFSPARHGPPRVGSTLQVAYMHNGGPAKLMNGVKLGLDLQHHVLGGGVT